MKSRSKPLSLQTVSEFGGIDILIANAGVLWLGPIESTPLKRWQLCLNVNLTGVFLVTKAVIPHVRARGGGSLIAITTTGVGMIEHGSNAYWVSKAGVERLYLGLAADLKPDNIAVNCLSPSRVVLTEGWQAGGGGMEIPPEMVEPPEAMANAAVLLAQQDAQRHHRHDPALGRARRPNTASVRSKRAMSRVGEVSEDVLLMSLTGFVVPMTSRRTSCPRVVVCRVVTSAVTPSWPSCAAGAGRASDPGDRSGR